MVTTAEITSDLSKIAYSISDALVTYGYSAEFLLGQGVLGAIDLYVRVPDKKFIYIVDQWCVDRERIAWPVLCHWRRPSRQFGIEGLRLEKADCTEMLRQGRIRRTYFDWACRLSTMSAPELIRAGSIYDRIDPYVPPEPITMPHVGPDGIINNIIIENISDIFVGPPSAREIPIWRFAAYSQDEQISYDYERQFFNAPSGVVLEIEEVFVLAADMLRLAQGTGNGTASGSDMNFTFPKGAENTHLMALHRVAVKHWKSIDPSDKERYPSTDKVIGSLVGYEISQALARRAASIIRPVYARPGATLAQKEQFTGYISPEFRALVAAWEICWNSPELRTSGKRYINSEVVALLRAEPYELSENAAKAGATLIKPDSHLGVSGRRPVSARIKR